MDCCNKNAITLVRGNDTDFNGQHLLTLNITGILDLSDLTASFTLVDVEKTFDDLTSGTIIVDYSAQETSDFPIGIIYGDLRVESKSGKISTIENRIPFNVVSVVHGDALVVKPYEYTINVEQGGENILNISVEAGVSVEVGSTETLAPGSQAYVSNSGTANHLVLNFGIPEGEKGKDGEEGPEGPEGPAGKDAKINGVNTLTLNATNGLALTQSGNVATISGKTIQDSVSSEALNRSNADNNLQQQIDAISASSDVTDIVGTHADLENYDTSKLKDNDIIKVLQDETEGGATTYYRWSTHTHTFTLIGEEGPYYTKSDADSKFVPKTTTINGKALSGDISLDASDVDAATSAQGAKADTAVQPGDLGTAAYENSSSFATSAQGAKADSAVQPSEISNMATTNTAQDITDTKTFKTQQKLQYGGGDGCLIIGADVTSNTVTANTRKLGRMAFHTNESTTLNCAFVSTDTQDATQAGVIKNCVEFGGRPADISSTSPDVINFTVATVHNATTLAEKKIGLSITKDCADFAVQPKYNGNDLVDVATVQTITGQKTFTGSPVFQADNYETLIIKRNSLNAGALITYSNNSGVLARMGINGLAVPIHIPTGTGATIRVLVRGGSQDSPTVGSPTQPVYIDSDGITQVCTGVQEKSTIQTLSATDSITLTDNYLYNGNTQTALTIALPAADVGFVSQITFTSGTTSTTLSYPNSIKWLGDDVNNNIFLPVVSKRYTVVFYYDGTQFVGVVKGVV